MTASLSSANNIMCFDLLLLPIDAFAVPSPPLSYHLRMNGRNRPARKAYAYEKSKIYWHTNDVTNTINFQLQHTTTTTHSKTFRRDTDLIQVDLSAGWMPKNLFMNVLGIPLLYPCLCPSILKALSKCETMTDRGRMDLSYPSI